MSEPMNGSDALLREALARARTARPSTEEEYDQGWDAALNFIERAALDATNEPEPLDVDTLSAALHVSAPLNHNVGEGPMRAICTDPMSHRRRAAVMLASMGVIPVGDVASVDREEKP